MTLAGPVAIRVNPSDSSQWVELWGNGRVDVFGGLTPVTGVPSFFHRTDQPVAVDIHISNWTTMAGQILDFQGAFHPVNGATQYMDNSDPNNPVNTLGLVYDYKRRYVRFFWNPSGAATGYALDGYGQWFPFGGETVPPRGGPRFTNWAVRGAAFNWVGTTKKAYYVDNAGAVWSDFSAATPPIAAPYYRGQDVARDLAITDWTVGKGYTLTGDGAVHAFGGATASGVAGPYRAGADVARVLYVISASDPVKFRQVHSGGEVFEYFNSTPPTVTAGGGQSEVQRITITGTPTAGTFTLTLSGQTTAAIAYNATATTVQTALRALSNIGSTGVNVTGGPGPGTAWVATFAGTLATTDVAQMTATSSLTGGTTPAVTVTTTTPGIASSPALIVTDTTRPILSWNTSDPENDSQAEWRLLAFTQAFVSGHTMTDPSVWASSALVNESGNNPTTRGIESPVDFTNGSFVEFVQVKDTSRQWSAWSSKAWTQSVTPPATPTGLTATANNTTGTIALSASATAGDYVKFERSADAGATYTLVPGLEQVPRIATTLATDRFPGLGVSYMYKATAYSVTPRTSSAASSTASATVTASMYLLTSVSNSALGGRFWVQEPVSWSRQAKAAVYETLGDEFPTVVSDGRPKARKGTVSLVTLDAAALASLEALVASDSTLVYRDPRGRVIYCRVVGDWSDLMMGVPAQYHDSIELPLVEVAPPILVT